MLDALREEPGALLLPVHAQPGARREGIRGVHAARLRVATSAPPEGGRANDRIGRALAELFAVPRSAVACVGGPAHRSKVFRIRGLTRAAAAALLREALS